MSEAIDRILARCEEVGECLEWQGALSKGGMMYVSIQGKKRGLRRILWEDKHGPIPDDRNISVSCGNPRCVLHLQSISIAKRNSRTAAKWFAGPAFGAKVAAAKRRDSKLSDEAVAQIRAWEGHVPEIAQTHGISKAYAYMIRRGRFRRAASNPFAGLIR